ncbi:condensation domain-containing protein [Polymorphospora sp. NPDC051019]|uniref:condensation domain-containing protein n=1 Tax=Polymorphospora sp. NPDC051019 TaxID=3155725 RepID=UPI00342C3527
MIEGTVLPTGPTTHGWTAVDFAATPTASAPITWGQRALWMAILRKPDYQPKINLRRVVAVPRRAPADVLRAVGALLTRHSSLRTRLRTVDGELRQVVADRGSQPVLLVPADTTADGVPTDIRAADGVRADTRAADVTRVADETAATLASTAFDHAEELPQRIALILVAGRVRQVVIVFSHTTVDFRAAELVLRDLRLLLLRGSIDTPAGLQSVDVAHREHDTAHRRRGERAVTHWVAGYGRLPRETLPPVGPPHSPRFRRGVLVSAAADTAVRMIANRHQVTSSTVILAATSLVLAKWSGNDVVGVYTMVSNRSLPGYDEAIAKLNQLGMVVVDLADRPAFADLLPRVWSAAMNAYRSAYYDPADMRTAFEAAGYPYATGINAHCYLNDIRLTTDADLFGHDTTPARVRAALAGSSFDWTESFDAFTWRTRIEIVDRPGGLGLALTADTTHLPPDRAERFLRDLDRLLVEAAFHDVPWPWL